jgi:hypothetical protein
MTVGRIRKDLDSNNVIVAPATRQGGDGRTINTANIGQNRPARIFEPELRTIVASWFAARWRQPWPENPSHTNGSFWQEITAWLHANEQRTWTESDLKEAIKGVYHAAFPQRLAEIRAQSDAMSAAPSLANQQMAAAEARHAEQPAQTPAPTIARPEKDGTFVAVWAIEKYVEMTFTDFYREEGAEYGARDMRAGARMRLGGFWQHCVIALNNAGYGPLDYRQRDLAQAINNVADHIELKLRAQSAQEQAAAPAQPRPMAEIFTPPDDDIADAGLDDVRERPVPDWMVEEPEPADPPVAAPSDNRALPAEPIQISVAPIQVSAEPIQVPAEEPVGEKSLQHRIRMLRGDRAHFSEAIGRLAIWAENTGHFTATIEAERGLKRIIELIDQELAALEAA